MKPQELTEEYVQARKAVLSLEYGILPDQVTILPYIPSPEEDNHRWIDEVKEVRSDTYDDPEDDPGEEDDTLSSK